MGVGVGVGDLERARRHRAEHVALVHSGGEQVLSRCRGRGEARARDRLAPREHVSPGKLAAVEGGHLGCARKFQSAFEVSDS